MTTEFEFALQGLLDYRSEQYRKRKTYENDFHDSVACVILTGIEEVIDKRLQLIDISEIYRVLAVPNIRWVTQRMRQRRRRRGGRY